MRKDDLRVETIGEVDEVNATLGVVRAELSGHDSSRQLDATLATVQHRLFDLGAELAMPDRSQTKPSMLNDDDVALLESAIDRAESALAPLQNFILPGGSPAAAQLHLTRCVCRRAERRLVQLAAVEDVRGELVRYLNRLSDLLFVLAREANSIAGVTDVNWERKE